MVSKNKMPLIGESMDRIKPLIILLVVVFIISVAFIIIKRLYYYNSDELQACKDTAHSRTFRPCRGREGVEGEVSGRTCCNR